MNLNRKQLKAEARVAMREVKPSIFLTSLVFIALVLVLEFLVTRLQNPDFSVWQLLLNAGFSPEDEFFLRPSLGLIPALLVLIISLMEPILDLGFKGVCLRTFRRESTGVGGLFEGFELPFKAIWLSIVKGFFIGLWSLLFVVPGIVASYRYSMAEYILLEDPGKGVLQCIRESKALTRGYKMDLFVLSLSFIGWILLSVIPGVIIYTLPYLEVSCAAYYDYLTAPVGGIDPADGQTTSGDDWFEQ